MLLVLVIWLHMWQQATPQVALPAPAAPLTVMSFNIRLGIANDGEDHWTKRREQLFALLREQRADVVGLQEAMHFQLEEIVRAVPGYDWVGVGRSDGRQAGEYSAILYRTARLTPRRSDTFWFSDTPTVPGSMSWGNRYERICTWAYFEDREGPAFYAYNVHLDHESQPSRERSADLLMRTVECTKSQGAGCGHRRLQLRRGQRRGEDGGADTSRHVPPASSRRDRGGHVQRVHLWQDDRGEDRLRVRRAGHGGPGRVDHQERARRAVSVRPFPGDGDRAIQPVIRACCTYNVRMVTNSVRIPVASARRFVTLTLALVGLSAACQSRPAAPPRFRRARGPR